MANIDLMLNGSFELPWEDLLPWGDMTNQVPAGFNLTIRVPGTRLVSADSYDGPDDVPIFTEIEQVPECVHKYDYQMGDAPERILDGSVVFLQPSVEYVKRGVDAELVERMTRFDGS